MPARTRFAGTSTSTTTSERRERRSTGTYDVLATLRRSGEPFQLTPGALGGSLMLSTGGMTGRLDRLEQAGLVTRCPGPGDRRSRLVTLTDRGRQLIDHHSTPAWRRKDDCSPIFHLAAASSSTNCSEISSPSSPAKPLYHRRRRHADPCRAKPDSRGAHVLFDSAGIGWCSLGRAAPPIRVKTLISDGGRL